MWRTFRKLTASFLLASGAVWSTPSLSVSATAHSDELVAFSDDKHLNLLSPDGRYRLVSDAEREGWVSLFVEPAHTSGASGRVKIGSYAPPTSVLWSPKSDAFILNDQRGSGQSSYMEIVRLDHGRFRRDVSARRNVATLYARLFECHLPEGGIITSGQAWFDDRTVLVEAQAQMHSGGCPLDPFASNSLDLLVDAHTGRIERRLLPRH